MPAAAAKPYILSISTEDRTVGLLFTKTHMQVTGPELLYKEFVEYFNLGKLYDLVNLYSDAAVLQTEQTAISYGRSQIFDVLRAFLDLGGTMYLATRFQMQAGDVALLSAEWRFVAGTEGAPIQMCGTSAEVCRRRGDEWKFVCSNWHADLTSKETSRKPMIHPGSLDAWAS